MHPHGPYRKLSCRSVVVHELESRHQVEVEIWPARAEVYFRDERFVNPANTQVRFDAVVYNSPSGRVTWEVKSVAGGPGAGSIDPSGLYTAPPKGPYSHGLTDLVVATSADDPFRKAYASVALIGFGPELAPLPTVEIFPKQAYIYFNSGHHNEYIDESNRQQRFLASLRNLRPGTAPDVEWLVGTDPNPKDSPSPYFMLKPAHIAGSPTTVTARLASDHNIKDTAIVYLLNYDWPGIVI